MWSESQPRTDPRPKHAPALRYPIPASKYLRTPVGTVQGKSLVSGFKPVNVLSGGARGRQRKAVFFFRSKLTLPEGEGPATLTIPAGQTVVVATPSQIGALLQIPANTAVSIGITAVGTTYPGANLSVFIYS